ncbi:MAG TPA: adenylosuccinate lyase family protein, partial [Pseudonocardiaceae bacterium]
PGQVGSITMPHKRNPEQSEHLVTLARVVRADAGVTLEGLVGDHERDGRSWKAEWVVLPEACLLTGVSLQLASRLLEGLVVHAGKMRANVEAGGGYILSEPVMRALADQIGKHAAQRAVYDATMAGLVRGITLGEALATDPVVSSHLDSVQITQCLDPYRALGATTAFVDRVLAAAECPL